MNLRVPKVVPNQELSLLISSGNSVSEGFSGDANFKLITNGEYTRLVFSSHAQFVSLSDRVFEPVLTIAMQRKIRDDLANLKILAQAQSEKSANPRASLWRTGNLGNYILSMIPAAPMPPPMHMVT